MSAVRRALIVLFLLAPPIAGAAQTSHEDWRTLEIPGFRIHYPVAYEAWTLRTAARLQDIRARVSEAVSFEPRQQVDVLVMDPLAQPNGFAIPLLGSPRMVLWANPPASDSIVGQFRSWPELLATHEDVHLVHLLRPSRNPIGRALERTFLPIGPIALRAPRWVTEGYATLLEGRLTGSGRPFSDLRAAILRRWAQQGRLPPYERLGADEERWQGMSMAYLAGSAFLEWLESARGPDGLRHLWARMTARTVRSFDAAFLGVFGAEPEELYGRFTAELTETAMALERTRAPQLREGQLWQRIEWTTGVPALSPDGSRLAVVVRDRERPPRLVVWSTGPDEEREREWAERVKRLLERDPQDVPPVRERPLPREPVQVLPARDGAGPEFPRWMPDGRSILFARFEADADGILRPDLFRWTLQTNRVARITRLADVRDADPMPDGASAIAVRNRHGFSQLVRVDLESGAVTPVTERSVEVVYDAPRVSPDGARLLYLRHAEAGWHPVVRDFTTGQERQLEVPPGATVTHPAWSPDGASVVLSIGEAGFIDLHRLPLNGGPAARLTQTRGAALGGQPSPDGSLYFLSLEPHGLDLRRVTIEPAAEPAVTLSAAARPPAVPPTLEAPPPRPAAREVGPGHPYRLGRQEPMPFVGGQVAPSGRLLELGLRGGDVVGRVNYFAAASIAGGEGAVEGVAFAAAVRRWRLAPRAHVFVLDDRPSAQPDVHGVGRGDLDAQRRGVELATDWRRQLGRRYAVGASGGGVLASVEPSGDTSLAQRFVFGDVRVRAAPSRGLWRARYGAGVRVDAGETGGDAWQRVGIDAEAGLVHHRNTIVFAYDRRVVSGQPSRFDLLQVGGIRGTILPPAFASGRVDVPALPLASLTGEHYERQRLDIRAIAPLPIFLERHRVWNRGGERGPWIRLVGTELAFAAGPIPLVRLPAPTVRIGVARVLDAPFDGENRWWASLSWRP